jgi:ADP-ribose pyrophosphatase YjhB (NUDIX family)
MIAGRFTADAVGTPSDLRQSPTMPDLHMNFCSQCGAKVALAIPDGDQRARFVCASCGTIHYQNPRLVVGTIPEWQGKILLCKRGIEPRLGKWTLPAGFMENGESVADGARRETREEALADVEGLELFTVLSVPHVDQVHVFYRAQLPSLDFGTTPESTEVQLFAEAEIPWDELAFRTVSTTLRHYFADRRTGTFLLHTSAILPPPS